MTRDALTVWCDLCSAPPGHPCRGLQDESSDKAEDLASGRAFHRRRVGRAAGEPNFGRSVEEEA